MAISGNFSLDFCTIYQAHFDFLGGREHDWSIAQGMGANRYNDYGVKAWFDNRSAAT
jgi:hypothetical protein